MPSGSKLSDFKKDWLQRYKRAGDLPFLALSAKSGRGVGKVWKMAEEVHDNFWRRIPTGELNRSFQKALQAHPPKAVSGKLPKLSYVTQSRTAPPRFVIFCNKPELVDETYLRYLERKFRKEFSFSGAPLQFSLRRKN